MFLRYITEYGNFTNEDTSYETADSWNQFHESSVFGVNPNASNSLVFPSLVPPEAAISEDNAQFHSHCREILSLSVSRDEVELLAAMMRVVRTDGMDVREGSRPMELWAESWSFCLTTPQSYPIVRRSLSLPVMMFWMALRRG